MSIATVVAQLAMVGVLALAVAGVDQVTGGEVYLGSLSQLAQSELPPPLESGGGGSGGGLPPPPIQSDSGSFQPQPAPGSFSQPPQEQFGVPQAGGTGFPGGLPQPVQFGQPPQGQFGPPPGQFDPSQGGQFGGGQQPGQFGQPPQGQFGPPQQGQFGPPQQNQFGSQKGTQFPGQGSQQQFPGQPEQSSGKGQNPFESGSSESGDHGEEEGEEEFVNPREIQDALKQVKQMEKQLRQTGKTRGISETDRLKAAELQALVSRFRQILSSGTVTREGMQEFWQSGENGNGLWEDVNNLENRVRIPGELNQLEKALKRVAKAAGTKAITNLGIDVGQLRQKIAEMQQAVSAARLAYGSADFEGAQELLNAFHEEGQHPGEIEGAISMLRDIKRMSKRAINSQAQQLLQEAIRLIDVGEYREAREYLEQNRKQLMKQGTTKTTR